MKKSFLLSPGPTPVPPEVLLRMARPIIHHRTPEFEATLAEAVDGLKAILRTANDVLVLTSSGTGAMEAAVANTVGASETALVVRCGKFSERWGEICDAFGIPFTAIDVEWGESVDPQLIRNHLDSDPSIGLVCTTQCETSTGALTDIEAIGGIVRQAGAVLAVDAISSAGALPIETDAWGIDLLVAGSQKALMLPPGLAVLIVSAKAWAKIDAAPVRSFYFDLKRARRAARKGTTPWTPAVTLVQGLRESLKMIQQEGIENVWARTSRYASATRAAVAALGMKLFATCPADCVTAAELPAGVDGSAIVKTMKNVYGVTVAGGQEHLSGKICRISHMGYLCEMDLIVAIAALELALAGAGAGISLGSGVAAAQKVLLNR